MDLERIRAIADRVAGSEGLELVGVEWAGGAGRGILRLTIDRPAGGVSHNDCQSVSEQVGAILDVEDLVPGRYILEVASPGLDRRLFCPADYERFRGRQVKVVLKRRREDLGGRRFKGELEGLTQGVVRFRLEGRALEVPYEEIERANLVPEI